MASTKDGRTNILQVKLTIVLLTLLFHQIILINGVSLDKDKLFWKAKLAHLKQNLNSVVDDFYESFDLLLDSYDSEPQRQNTEQQLNVLNSIEFKNDKENNSLSPETTTENLSTITNPTQDQTTDESDSTTTNSIIDLLKKNSDELLLNNETLNSLEKDINNGNQMISYNFHAVTSTNTGDNIPENTVLSTKDPLNKSTFLDKTEDTKNNIEANEKVIPFKPLFSQDGNSVSDENIIESLPTSQQNSLRSEVPTATPKFREEKQLLPNFPTNRVGDFTLNSRDNYRKFADIQLATNSLQTSERNENYKIPVFHPNNFNMKRKKDLSNIGNNFSPQFPFSAYAPFYPQMNSFPSSPYPPFYPQFNPRYFDPRTYEQQPKYASKKFGK